MMKKLQIKSWILLLAVLLGGGSAWAEDVTYKLTINGDDFNSKSYAANNNEKTSTAVGVTDPTKTYEVKWTSNQVMLSGGHIQWQKNNGYIYNSTDLGTISNVNLEIFEGSFTTYYGDSEQPSSSTTAGGGFFQVKVGSATGKIDKLEVTFTISEGSSNAVATTTSINATGITNTDVYLSADAGSLSATVFAGEDEIENAAITWTSSNESVATINESTGAVTLVSAGNTTITALYAGEEDVYNSSFDTYELTVTDSTPKTGGWVLTDIADIAEGDEFVIVGTKESESYALPHNGGTSSSPTKVKVTIENDEIASEVSDNIKWNISGNADDGYTFYPNGSTTTWLYCTNSNTGIRVGTNDDKTFTINGGYLYHTATGRYVGFYTSDWRCYTSINSNITGETFAFYKYVNNSGVQTPHISANAVDLAYDATSGSIAFTLTNPVDGGVMTASTTDTWITLGTVGETVPFTCSANEANTARTATVTLTYSYGDNETVTKDVTITQAAAPAPAVVYNTIPALFEAATSDETEVQVTFDNWVVSGVSTNGKNVFVTDNSGNGFVIYDNSDMSETYSAGKVLSGAAVTCTLKKYNGFAELLNVDATALTISDGGTVTEATVAMADLSGVNTGALVSYENLTCSINNNKYYLSDGTTTLQVYNALYAYDALEDGKTYNIKGIYQQYNNTKEILPRSADDIVEVVSTEPSITVDPATVDVDADEHDGTLALDYANLTISDMDDFGIQYYNAEGEELNDKDAPDWIEVTVAEQDPEVGEGYVVSYYMIENDGEARTAYFKVYAMDDETNLVYSNKVTVTQAAYVAPDVPVVPAVAGVGAFVKVTSTADITSGNYLIVYETNSVAFNGSLGTLDAEHNKIDVIIIDGKIAATNATVASTFTIQPSSGTIQSASGKYIGVSSNSNGLKQDDDASAYTHTFGFDDDGNAKIFANFSQSTMYLRFNKASNQDRFRYYKNAGQEPIQLYKYVATEPAFAPVKVTAAGYATYCFEKDIDFSGTGLTAYKATVSADKKVSFTEVTEVPAGEGVLLKGVKDAVNTYAVPVIESATEITDNAFIGVTEETTIDTDPENGIFVLMNPTGEESKGVGFYKTTDSTFTLSAHTAYLPALGDGARTFIGFDFNDATAINGIAAETMANGEVYNLQGQRVVKAQKGLYIMNGKKVLVK